MFGRLAVMKSIGLAIDRCARDFERIREMQSRMTASSAGNVNGPLRMIVCLVRPKSSLFPDGDQCEGVL